MSAASTSGDAGLLEIIRFYLRHPWMTFGVSIIFGFLAIGASFLMTPVYRADVLLVPVEQSAGGAVSSLLQNLGGLGRLAGLAGGRTRQKNEALAMLQSRAFVSAFIDANDGFAAMYPGSWDAEAGEWTVSADQVPSDLDVYFYFTGSILGVSEDENTGTITVAIKLANRFLVAQWANDIVSMLNEKFRSRVSAEARRSIDYLNEELGKASLVELRRVIHRLIEGQIETIMLTNVRKEFVFRVIDPAVVQDDDRYVSPRRARIAFIGLLFGGFLGTGVAAFRDAMRAGARVQAAVTN